MKSGLRPTTLPQALIIEPYQPDDFLGGTIQSLEIKYGAAPGNPAGDWSDYLPATENQDTSDGDTWACTNFGTSNAVEILARFNFKETINLSDRFFAKVSGTRVGVGNSPKTAADALRHQWSVNEDEWPDVNTVEEYYAEIQPPSLKTVALARGAEFEFGYQYVSNTLASIKEALKSSPVCIAVTAWQEENGVYTRIPGITENHWTTIIKVLDNGNYRVFDSFEPFIKEVSPACAQSVAMSYYLDKQVVSETLFQKFIRAILALFKAPPAPQQPATPPVKRPETPLPAPQPTVPTVPPAPASPYDWSTPEAARHSARLICDEEGLSLLRNIAVNSKTYMLKDILCACLEQESHYDNNAVNHNRGDDGKVMSSDWGVAQINDYWHIGPGKDFPTVAYVVANPDAAVRYMARMFKAGNAHLWTSYVSGAYKQWL